MILLDLPFQIETHHIRCANLRAQLEKFDEPLFHRSLNILGSHLDHKVDGSRRMVLIVVLQQLVRILLYETDKTNLDNSVTFLPCPNHHTLQHLLVILRPHLQWQLCNLDC